MEKLDGQNLKNSLKDFLINCSDNKRKIDDFININDLNLGTNIPYYNKNNMNIKDEEVVLIVKCPVCKNEHIKDISTYESNGIFGSGYHSWKTSDLRCCEDCGIVFKCVKGNGI